SDDITVGTLFRTAAKGASLGDPELLQAGGISHGQPFEFTNAEEARAYLTKRGVLNVFNSIYFPSDTETTATIGQIMSVLGNLYNVLMEK
ncbi:MAG: hypothetical protein FWB75_10135, partial [Oscillospiraceae bacterium]|nr:hypothetical protein [Oscillospiraceae bacterium]